MLYQFYQCFLELDFLNYFGEIALISWIAFNLSLDLVSLLAISNNDCNSAFVQ
jgi:hypothetical protein